MYKLTIRSGKSSRAKILKGVQPNQTLLEICLNNGVDLRHQCGGVCHCTTCVVRVVKGMEALEEPSRRELDFLKRKTSEGPDARLSCQSMLLEGSGEVEITIPESGEA